MKAPWIPGEELHLLKLDSLNWDARQCLPVAPQGVPAHVHVGSYSEGPQSILSLGPTGLHWSKKHVAYVYNLVPPNKPVTMQYTRRRFTGTRCSDQTSFTAYHAFGSNETVGAKLALTVLGSGDRPFSERLPDLKDSDAEILAQKYPARVFERGPNRFDFFDVDFLEDDEAVQPRAVGKESAYGSMNISEPELIGQPPREAAQPDQESQHAKDSPVGDEYEDLGWTGRWVDTLLAVAAKGGTLWTRREVKWHHDAAGNRLWGVVMVFKPIAFEQYTPKKGTKHPHKSIQAYTVQATVKKVYVTLKGIELMGGPKSEDVKWLIFDGMPHNL